MKHINTASTHDLVAQVRVAGGSAESALVSIEVLAVFDHDYQQHILIQEWDRFADTPAWIYSLWLVDGNCVTRVHSFLDPWPLPPFVAAAQIAERWRNSH